MGHIPGSRHGAVVLSRIRGSVPARDGAVLPERGGPRGPGRTALWGAVASGPGRWSWGARTAPGAARPRALRPVRMATLHRGARPLPVRAGGRGARRRPERASGPGAHRAGTSAL